jgi:membrane peptidoglycan carboxypeptidase
VSYPSEYGPDRRTAGSGTGGSDDDFWGPLEPDRPARGGGSPGRQSLSRQGPGRGDDGYGGSGRGSGRGGSGSGGRYRGGGGRGGSGGGRRRRDGSGAGGPGGAGGTPEKTGWRRYIPSWKVVLAVMGLGTLSVIVLIVVAYAMTPVPSEAQSDATAQGSVVYYEDGKTPMMRLGRHRESVPLNKIPQHVQDSVLAAEDRGFYTEPGVSPKGIGRAVWTSATGGDVTGGSTITQQMARNYYEGLSQQRTMSRKFKEILISVRLGKEKPKTYILGTYLNTVYFGRQAYGIQAAARAYFGRDVSKLTVSQSAMLAAMIQQPAYFHTQGNDAAAQALRVRWNYVLDGLVTMGKLAPADRAKQVFPKTTDSWSDVKETGQSGYIQQQISKELSQAGIPETQLGSAGLKIHTALDPKWMSYAERAVRAQGVGSWPRNIGVGLVAVDPKTGAVKAFYGGNWKRSQYDTVFNPSAQVGSSFKPYVLATALKRGDNVKSMISGKSPQRFGNNGENLPLNSTGGYLVQNDEGDPPMNVIDLVQATQMSVNTAYVKLGLNVGLDNVAQTAAAFGIPERYLENFKGQAGLSLGIANIPAVYQASGYAAFANGGTPVTPHLITKITDARGKSIGNLPWKKKAEPVLTQEEAAQATYAMRSVVTRGTGTRAALPDRQVAGKTGTTEKNKAAWFVGYVPQLSTAVTMFNTKNKPLAGIPGYQRSVYGGTIPASIWKNFMSRVTSSMPPVPFQAPTFAGNRQLWDSPPPPTPTPTPTAPTNTPSTPPEGPVGPSTSSGPILPFPRDSDSPAPTPSPGKSHQEPIP